MISIALEETFAVKPRKMLAATLKNMARPKAKQSLQYCSEVL